MTIFFFYHQSNRMVCSNLPTLSVFALISLPLLLEFSPPLVIQWSYELTPLTNKNVRQSLILIIFLHTFDFICGICSVKNWEINDIEELQLNFSKTDWLLHFSEVCDI